MTGLSLRVIFSLESPLPSDVYPEEATTSRTVWSEPLRRFPRSPDAHDRSNPIQRALDIFEKSIEVGPFREPECPKKQVFSVGLSLCCQSLQQIEQDHSKKRKGEDRFSASPPRKCPSLEASAQPPVMQRSPELVEVARSLSSDDSGFDSDLLQSAEDVEDELESEDELGSDDSSLSEDDISPRHIGRSVTFTISQKGKQLANFLGFEFHRHSSVKTFVYWRCTRRVDVNCPGRIVTDLSGSVVKISNNIHPEHLADSARESARTAKASLKQMAVELTSINVDTSGPTSPFRPSFYRLSSLAHKMNIVLATQKYVDEMIRCAGPGMKVLLMDKETTSLISCVFAQSDMMQNEVYLFERLDAPGPRDAIKYLKCIVFVRPTPENLLLIAEELKRPRFGNYHIYFSNIISKTDVKMLAEADEQESVRDMFEFFLDGIALAPHLMSLEMPNCYETRFALSPAAFRRSLNSVLALCLALNKRPYVRYQSSSRDSQRLSEELTKLFTREEALFQERTAASGSDDDTMLLILSRTEDAVSPLLNQWTYEAMVHELLGLVHNRVKIPGEDGQPNDVLLSPIHDDFYAVNMYLNFGELGQNIKELMNEYQAKAQTHQKLESISDMKHFVEQYPQFRKMSGTVSKHMSMLCELNRLVSKLNLLEVSELEQTIVSSGERSQCLDAAQRLLRTPSVQDHDALRLVMLYALRFESHSAIADDLNGLVALLRERRVPSHQIAAIKTLQEYGGAARRQNDLFGNQSAMEITKRFIKGLKGVENIYTHHQPFLAQVVDQIVRGRLPDGAYPYVGSANRAALANSIPENVIIFLAGGATYEESAWVHSHNQQIPQQKARGRAAPRLLLASTHVHNSKSFIEQMTRLSPGGGGSTNVSLR
ncbi:hypothetical protein QR680_017224 [Steinernema hermaphroditum]|uniref:FLYWCH-type domain-containing protein n=1 Tax=Steinernema hermaphroditum TaxID=289476 RepID=A0AA39LNW7_9BILA|nr:hypothetical protein QR680_017224 [Steinernema hermaphroditum]